MRITCAQISLKATARTLVRQQFGPLPACSFGLNADPAAEHQLHRSLVEPQRVRMGNQSRASGRYDLRSVVHLCREWQPPCFSWRRWARPSPGSTPAISIAPPVPPVPRCSAAVVGTATLTFSNGNSADVCLLRATARNGHSNQAPQRRLRARSSLRPVPAANSGFSIACTLRVRAYSACAPILATVCSGGLSPTISILADAAVQTEERYG